MRTVFAALVALPLLSGCIVPDAPFQGAAPQTRAAPAATTPEAPQRPTPPSPVYTIPHSAPPAPGEVTPPLPAPAVPSPPGDTCGAAGLADLVGKPRTEIPVPADLTHRRVVCSTCPVTQDYAPDRQTITYDSATRRVTKVACG